MRTCYSRSELWSSISLRFVPFPSGEYTKTYIYLGARPTVSSSSRLSYCGSGAIRTAIAASF